MAPRARGRFAHKSQSSINTRTKTKQYPQKIIMGDTCLVRTLLILLFGPFGLICWPCTGSKHHQQQQQQQQLVVINNPLTGGSTSAVPAASSYSASSYPMASAVPVKQH
jgi:hypothetical protein